MPGDDPGPGTGAAAGGRTADGEALTRLVLPVFELDAEFLAAAELITRPAGLTPAWWQVLAATRHEALTVAEIARRVRLGLTRQSVQRVADLLAGSGWAVYRPNPAHRRAQLLEPTPEGRLLLDRLAAAQHAWADEVGAEVGEVELARTRAVLGRLATASRAYRQAVPEALPAAGSP